MAGEKLSLEPKPKLKERLLDFVEATGVNLNNSEKIDLANEYYSMFVGWLKQSPKDRKAFLEREKDRIVKRFTSGKVYSFSIVGHFNEPPDDEDAAHQHGSNFLRRVFDKIEEPSTQAKSSEESEIPLVKLKSVERQGRSYRIKANITIHRSTPKQRVKRALSRAKRKGRLKIEQLTLEGLVYEEAAV